MRLIEATKRFRVILVGLFLLIFSAYYVNSTMFFHRHVVDGDTLYHSHFHSKLHTSSSGDGGHTVEVVKLIAALNSIAVEQQEFNTHLAAVERPLEAIVSIPNCVAVALPTKCYFSLRAPPCI